MKFRGQAAMEFLMTYGWAILIMLVVIAVLFYLGVFTPGTSVPSRCTLPAGFTCYDYALDTSGNLSLDLGQAIGRDINIWGFACNVTGPTPSPTNMSTNVTVYTGSHAIIMGTGAPTGDFSGPCCGSPVASPCKIKIAIKYNYVGSTTYRTIYGDVSGPLTTLS